MIAREVTEMSAKPLIIIISISFLLLAATVAFQVMEIIDFKMLENMLK